MLGQVHVPSCACVRQRWTKNYCVTQRSCPTAGLGLILWQDRKKLREQRSHISRLHPLLPSRSEPKDVVNGVISTARFTKDLLQGIVLDSRRTTPGHRVADVAQQCLSIAHRRALGPDHSDQIDWVETPVIGLHHDASRDWSPQSDSETEH